MLQRQLGNIVINRIIEWDEPNFDPLVFFPQTTPEDWEPHKAWLDPVSAISLCPYNPFWCVRVITLSSLTRASATTRIVWEGSNPRVGI